jgi:hypothetical protein
MVDADVQLLGREVDPVLREEAAGTDQWLAQPKLTGGQ